MAKVPNGVETLPKISIAWVGCTNVTDDRQTDDRQTTDGRTTTYSEHEHEFTFAKNGIKVEGDVVTHATTTELFLHQYRMSLRTNLYVTDMKTVHVTWMEIGDIQIDKRWYTKKLLLELRLSTVYRNYCEPLGWVPSKRRPLTYSNIRQDSENIETRSSAIAENPRCRVR